MEENKISLEISDSSEEKEEIVSEEPSLEEEHHHSHHHHSHHHHSHHRSHHRHHRHRKPSSRKKAAFKEFMAKNKKRIANAVVALVFVAVLIVVGFYVDNSHYKKEKKQSKASSSAGNSYINIKIPFFTEDVVIVGPAVEKLAESYPEVTATEIFQQLEGKERLDTGLPVTISYSIEGIPEGYRIKSVKVSVSESSDFSNAIVVNPKVSDKSAKIYHLKTNTKYYFRVSATISNGNITSVEGNFKTADTPRVLSLQGVGNARDIGGYKTSDGKTVKQGLLYRGCEIDGAVEAKYTASEKGISDMLTVLGIRSDMDLRGAHEAAGVTDALGANVKHTFYDAPMYTDAFTDEGKKKIRSVFADLAKKENYPVYLHCTHGMDRTGTVCYLLGAVLGMSEDDLMFDYQLSALYHGNLWAQDQMDTFVNRLKMQQGNNLKEKAESYLFSIGVTDQEIANLREIYLS